MRASQSARELVGEPDVHVRLSSAWDGEGSEVFSVDNGEYAALLAFARLPAGLVRARWAELGPHERCRLLAAVGHAIEFGRRCERLFEKGGGRGAGGAAIAAEGDLY